MEREAIAKGLKESIEIVQHATGQNSREIIALLTLNQYLDTMKSMANDARSKVIFMDTSVRTTTGMTEQLIAALESQSGESTPVPKK